jgi:hypothetical protein
MPICAAGQQWRRRAAEGKTSQGGAERAQEGGVGRAKERQQE